MLSDKFLKKCMEQDSEGETVSKVVHIETAGNQHTTLLSFTLSLVTYMWVLRMLNLCVQEEEQIRNHHCGYM